MESNSVPHRFTEKQFRKYELCIAQIVKNWPAITIFEPASAGLSLETFTCRLRDAMTACVKHNYQSPTFSKAQLSKINELKDVAQRDGKVYVGPADALKTFQPIISPNQSLGSEETYKLTNPSKEVFNAFCLLLSERHLTKPLKVRDLDPQLLLEAQNSYDIDASITPDGSTIII